MIHQFKQQRRVQFPETDMAGIMHFSNYLRFMEEAELEMYYSLGLEIDGANDEIPFGLPRVHAEVDFRAPLKYRDVVETQVLVRRIGNKSLSYDFFMRKMDGAENQVVATGNIVVTVIKQNSFASKPETIEVPAIIKKHLEEAPKELLIKKE
jgi:acyl-CoA thioester hydrolase